MSNTTDATLAQDSKTTRKRTESLSQPPDDWSADEEMLLIEGIQQSGLGNWMDVAEHVGTKNKDQCERHYHEVYINSPTWPRPAYMDQEFDASKPATRPPAFRKPRPTPVNPRLLKPLASQPTNHEIQGYMPARLEFEVEYENDAENYVKDLVFNPDDSPEETELKLVVMDIYNSRLRRRMERKQFIQDRGLLEYKKLQAIDKKRTKEERDIWSKCKVFSRLQTAKDHQLLGEGLVREQQLRQQIAVLQEYRRNGVTQLKEGEKYEIARNQRWQLLKANGIRDPHPSLVVDRQQRGGTVRSTPNAWGFDTNITASMRPHTVSDGGVVTSGGQVQPSGRLPNGPPSRTTTTPNSVPSTPSTGISTPVSIGGRRQANPLNLDNAEGVHLLSPEEQQLCSVLRIMPRPYLVIKETILKEYAIRGSLRRRETREMIKIDVNKTSRLYDFFLSMGWITAPGRTAIHWQGRKV
ncbi:Transcriptional adapter ada2 [Dispira simplex]|nr:Transcriptional adapter ada2 [Dispira simplex]